MRRKRLLLLAAAALYASLLVLLTAVERTSPDASIRTIPLALWYSLTTLTTVGYGDLYPVTTAGRIVGAVFQLSSLGVLAMLIGAFVSLLRSRFLPLAKLSLSRKREWFVFPETASGFSPAARALAASLCAEDPERVIVLCGTGGKAAEEPEGLRVIASPIGPAALAKRKGDGRIAVFLMDENGAENERHARELEGAACQVYCMTELEPDVIPERRHSFDPYDCCARLYWRRFPLLAADETVVIIGDGKYAEAILACGLELNVIAEEMHARYLVFGDFGRFLRNHYQLSEFLSVGKTDPGRDSLIVSDQPWNADPALLESAARIVICPDSEADTIRTLTELKRFFPVSCPIHARLSMPFDDVRCFGSTEELFSPELVLRAKLNETAMGLNEIYRCSAGGNAPAWGELSSFARRSNVASAEHLRVKARILLGADAVGDGALTKDLCRRAYAVFSSADANRREAYRRIEHERWMRFHYMNNWRYAPVRNNAARCHPLLVPFDRLSEADQRKDDYGWELLKALSDD